MTNRPTTAKLRHDIEHGRAGDKVDAFDPAAAPLGTDDEAAGTPPSPEAIKLAHDHEVGAAPVSSERGGDNGVAIYVSVVLTIAAAVGLAILLL